LKVESVFRGAASALHSPLDNERIRGDLHGAAARRETLNWGQVLVYWVGDREIGGKSFAMTNVDNAGDVVLSFRCGDERFHELLEMDGIRPRPTR